MTTIRLPESFVKHLTQIAEQHGIPLDKLVERAVMNYFSEEYFRERTKNASREKFLAVLNKVPDVEPPEYDKL